MGQLRWRWVSAGAGSRCPLYSCLLGCAGHWGRAALGIPRQWGTASGLVIGIKPPTSLPAQQEQTCSDLGEMLGSQVRDARWPLVLHPMQDAICPFQEQGAPGDRNNSPQGTCLAARWGGLPQEAVHKWREPTQRGCHLFRM